MHTFDDIEVSRPELAKSYLGLLAAQPGRPLALFAARRFGKTYFLDRDLTPAAQAAGLVAVCADVRLHKAAPLAAINHALAEALDDIDIPAGALRWLARTPVRKVGALGASQEVGDAAERRPLPNELHQLPQHLTEKDQGMITGNIRRRSTRSGTSSGPASGISRRPRCSPSSSRSSRFCTPVWSGNSALMTRLPSDQYRDAGPAG
ncbi:MAG: hypothetical protein KDI45_16065 [Candidatus Accumulibacter sp.]|nr:hypothetical protein [Accumulibacter sp.]